MRAVSTSFVRNSFAMLLCAGFLSACGGGSGSSSSSGSSGGPTPTYTLGGTINGIQSGNQVTLTNGSDTITVASNGSFSFDQGLAAGTAFNVTVNSPSQPCIALFSNGAMTSAGVSTVQVQCGPQEQETFHAAGSITVTPANQYSGQSLYALPDGSAVLFIYNNTDSSSVVERYNPITQTWTPYQSMSSSEIAGSAQLRNGTILISTATGMQVFDAVADTLSATIPFPANFSAVNFITLLDGRVMATDGFGTIGLLDLSTGTWSTAASYDIQGASLVLLESGKVLASGGENGLAMPLPIGNSEVYDPVANTWTPVGSMINARSGHATILMPGGKVLAIGGSSGPGVITADTSAELFDPTTGQWSAAGEMQTARQSPSVTLMPTGKVLVAGGQGSVPGTAVDTYVPASFSSTEVYDPQTNAWSAWGNLLNARAYHSAALLSSGQVLIAGGTVVTQSNGTEVPVAPAELGW